MILITTVTFGLNIFSDKNPVTGVAINENAIEHAFNKE